MSVIRHVRLAVSRPGAISTTKRSTTISHVFDALRRLTGQPDRPQQAVEVTDGDEEDYVDEEDSTMRRLDDGSFLDDSGSATFGPLAVLMVGFMSNEVQDFRKELDEIGAEQVRVIPATRAMMKGPLQLALEVQDIPPYEQPALGTRRAVVMSGMLGSEIAEIVACYQESGLPPSVFAAAVPRNYQREVAELLTEVAAEHAMMQQRNSAAGASN